MNQLIVFSATCAAFAMGIGQPATAGGSTPQHNHRPTSHHRQHAAQPQFKPSFTPAPSYKPRVVTPPQPAFTRDTASNVGRRIGETAGVVSGVGAGIATKNPMIGAGVGEVGRWVGGEVGAQSGKNFHDNLTAQRFYSPAWAGTQTTTPYYLKNQGDK